MTLHRKNTLVVDFSVLPKRPIMAQVEEFLKDRIKLDMADVKSIQIHNLKNCVFIEMNDAGVAPRLQKQHHLRHWFIDNGINYHVPVYVDGPTTTLRIHDLPPQMCNTVISNSMQQYGKVLAIQNKVWKNFFSGIPNGVRIVKMRLEKTVPSHIVVNNHPSLVTHQKANEQSGRGDTLPPVKVHNDKNNNQRNSDDLSESSETSDDDDENSSNNDNGEHNNNGDIETAELESGKRRLSTESSIGTKGENQPKRSCSQGGQKCNVTSEKNHSRNDQEWKIYNTRSKKK